MTTAYTLLEQGQVQELHDYPLFMMRLRGILEFSHVFAIGISRWDYSLTRFDEMLECQEPMLSNAVCELGLTGFVQKTVPLDPFIEHAEFMLFDKPATKSLWIVSAPIYNRSVSYEQLTFTIFPIY